MNRLSDKKREQIVKALVEGCSIRATSRMVGCSKNTTIKLLCELGKACTEIQDKLFRNLTCKRLQLDEIWSFCYAKNANVPEEKRDIFGYGDVWTWTAIDADTKLVVSWLVGCRTTVYAKLFVADLASRLCTRPQISTDGLSCYVEAMRHAFQSKLDWGIVEKYYGRPEEPRGKGSGAVCIGANKLVKLGKPDPKHISTSYIERQNLTMRMHMRRFTRLTNGFSKKVENHTHAHAIHFAYYNLCRKHQTLGKTPAMAAGVVNRPWTVRDLLSFL